jgi:hypothetical protein
LAILVGTAGTTRSLHHDSGGVTYENYKKITAGMTREQVEKLLGGPPGDYSICGPVVLICGGNEWWLPQDPRWIGDEGEIIVRFTDDGRVAAFFSLDTGSLSRAPMAVFVKGVQLRKPGVLDRFSGWISGALERLGL